MDTDGRKQSGYHKELRGGDKVKAKSLVLMCAVLVAFLALTGVTSAGPMGTPVKFKMPWGKFGIPGEMVPASASVLGWITYDPVKLSPLRPNFRRFRIWPYLVCSQD
jgi:hypothetical protein